MEWNDLLLDDGSITGMQAAAKQFAPSIDNAWMSPASTDPSMRWILFLSEEDPMVHVARAHAHPIGNSWRMKQILTDVFNEMMPYLQQHFCVEAVSEFINGMDFYMRDGAPKCWERWFYIMNFSSLWILVPCSFLFSSIWIVFVLFNWYQLNELYRKFTNQKRLLYYQFRLSCHWVYQGLLTSAQRNRYHSEFCPICLESFILSPAVRGGTKWYTGSDSHPCTVLRCGHAYDTSCWTIWVKQYALKDGKIIKCVICQQEI